MTFAIDRRFDAPRSAVWRAWTDPTLFCRWYGPGCTTTVSGWDVTPGAVATVSMVMGDRPAVLQRFEFVDVEPDTRLSFLQTTIDADGGVVVPPHMPNWPRVLLAAADFVDEGAGTLVRFSWTPVDARAEEVETFAAMTKGGMGWEKGFAEIDAILRS